MLYEVQKYCRSRQAQAFPAPSMIVGRSSRPSCWALHIWEQPFPEQHAEDVHGYLYRLWQTLHSSAGAVLRPAVRAGPAVGQPARHRRFRHRPQRAALRAAGCAARRCAESGAAAAPAGRHAAGAHPGMEARPPADGREACTLQHSNIVLFFRVQIVITYEDRIMSLVRL